MNPDTRKLMEQLDICFAIKRGDITAEDLVERPREAPKVEPAPAPAKPVKRK